MKRVILLFVSIIPGVCSYAQTPVTRMELVSEFPIGVGQDEIQYSVGPYEGESPAVLSFCAGGLLWIGEVRDAKLFDIKKKAIVQTVPYPEEDYSRRIRVGIHHSFDYDSLIVSNVHMLRYKVTRDPLVIGAPLDYGGPEVGAGPYLARSYVLFYGSDGLVYGIDPKGLLLSNSSTVTLLRDWLRTTWYPAEADRVFHASMIDTGKYIIVDGSYYPASGQQMLEYFTAEGVRLDADLRDSLKSADYSTPPDGMSLNGDVYMALKAGVYVISQRGATEAIIDDNSINPRIADPRYNHGSARNDVGPILKAIHPNGDLYTLYAIKDNVARMHRALKTWGNDLIGMARSGVATGNETSMREQLQGFSSIELRLLRNALFALHGYAFQSWDLATYFGGYDWYTPDPEVKNDSSILTTEQKRLFDIVVGIENQRVVTQ